MTEQRIDNPWSRQSSRIIYSNPWFRVREDTVTRPNGEPGVYGVVEMPEYAGVVAVDDVGRIALVRQWRYLYGEQSLEVPAGNAEPGDETPLGTAKRELLEETGLVAERWTSLGSVRYSAVTNVGNLFLARSLSPASQAVEIDGRDDWTELVWLDYDHAVDLLLKGEIMESTSLAALGKAEVLRQRGGWAL